MENSTEYFRVYWTVIKVVTRANAFLRKAVQCCCMHVSIFVQGKAVLSMAMKRIGVSTQSIARGRK